MENVLIGVVALLVILVIALLVVVIIFLFKFLKIKEQELNLPPKEKYSPEIQNLITELSSKKQDIGAQFCVDHDELPAKGICSISDQAYCELCLSKEGDIKLARKYLNLYLDHEWKDLFILNDEDLGPDRLNDLIRIKKDLWAKSEIPLITQKQFKINIEKDRIEAYTLVKARVNDSDSIQNKLSFLPH